MISVFQNVFMAQQKRDSKVYHMACAMLCYARPCCAMLRHAMLCYAVLSFLGSLGLYPSFQKSIHSSNTHNVKTLRMFLQMIM